MKSSYIREDIKLIEEALSTGSSFEQLVDIHRKIDCKYSHVIPNIGMSMYGYNSEFGFCYDMLFEDSIKDNLVSLKYKLEGICEDGEGVAKTELELLIDCIPDIVALFKNESFIMASGPKGKSGIDLKVIYKEPAFLEWAAKVQAEIDTYPDSSLKADILKLLGTFNGWNDEKSFNQLTAKLRALPVINPGSTLDEKEATSMIDNKKVLVVHGRKESVRNEVELFLLRIGLEPIILCNQPDGGLTIIEKIEEYSNVGFALVLYTDCDLGKLKDDEELKPRARQNVVFEHGYLIGKLSRKNVVALVEQGVETPGDVAGVIYVSLEETDWKQHVMREMNNCGLSFDWAKA